MLRPWRKGETGRVSNVASLHVETQRNARENSMKALLTLVERLDDPDGRIAVVAANSILERAWGKVREQKPEQQRQAHIDLSRLSAAELKILMDLALSGRLHAISNADPDGSPPVTEAQSVDEQ
jgi:hypothetical protein